MDGRNPTSPISLQSSPPSGAQGRRPAAVETVSGPACTRRHGQPRAMPRPSRPGWDALRARGRRLPARCRSQTPLRPVFRTPSAAERFLADPPPWWVGHASSRLPMGGSTLSLTPCCGHLRKTDCDQGPAGKGPLLPSHPRPARRRLSHRVAHRWRRGGTADGVGTTQAVAQTRYALLQPHRMCLGMGPRGGCAGAPPRGRTGSAAGRARRGDRQGGLRRGQRMKRRIRSPEYRW